MCCLSFDTIETFNGVDALLLFLVVVVLDAGVYDIVALLSQRRC